MHYHLNIVYVRKKDWINFLNLSISNIKKLKMASNMIFLNKCYKSIYSNS